MGRLPTGILKYCLGTSVYQRHLDRILYCSSSVRPRGEYNKEYKQNRFLFVARLLSPLLLEVEGVVQLGNKCNMPFNISR